MKIKEAWDLATKILVKGDIDELKTYGLVLVRRSDLEELERREEDLAQEITQRPFRRPPSFCGRLNDKAKRILALVDRAVATHTQISIHRLHSREGSRPAVDARALACLVARSIFLISWPLLGEHFSRHHATLLTQSQAYETFLQKEKNSIVARLTTQVLLQLETETDEEEP